MIRVLLVTRIQLIGNTVAATMEEESNIEVVGCLNSPEEALGRMPGTDVVLVSPRLPQGGCPGRKLLSTQESAVQLA